jgi:hypothetical protein
MIYRGRFSGRVTPAASKYGCLDRISGFRGFSNWYRVAFFKEKATRQHGFGLQLREIQCSRRDEITEVRGSEEKRASKGTDLYSSGDPADSFGRS